MFAVLQRRMITWTSVLVICLGALGVAIMLQPPKSLAAKKTRQPASSLVRGPASAQPATFSAVALNEKDHAIDITLPCGAQHEARFAPAVTQIRIKGMPCSSKTSVVASEILNETNGFSATVFRMSDQSFTTDYMTLAPGPNKIRILHIDQLGGRHEQAYLIDRSAPEEN